jgi:hypothetical protein
LLKIVISGKLDLFAKLRHLALMLIFKIFRKDEWLEFKALGKTEGAPIDVADGFIHFSKAGQVQETVEKHFKDEKDLILVSCNAGRFGTRSEVGSIKRRGLISSSLSQIVIKRHYISNRDTKNRWCI